MQFASALESYPELKANESVMKLLNQIQDCENTNANFKIEYNTQVENYNAAIHSFPSNIIRHIFKYKDAEFYYDHTDDLVSDEELGI